VFRDLRAGHAIDELKSSFVASISHELRTPLALISGYSQSLLELDLDDVARRRFIERIDGTANRMRGLVDQLLDVATLESDRLAVDPRRIPLQPLLKSIIDDVAEVPDSLAVSLSVPPDLPPVYADPARFGQVVANLLDNARKYGTPGSMVTVRVTRADNQAVVTVDNDGPEIASEEREAVFERFYRGRDARSSGTPGAGLGLYLSRRLVEAHGGRTRLEERRGGTCVSLTLPLALEGWTQNDGEEAAIDRPAFGTLNERSTAPEIDQRGGP
jgi:two-component system phosphate regulon sensor histidine kinase PhoR